MPSVMPTSHLSDHNSEVTDRASTTSACGSSMPPPHAALSSSHPRKNYWRSLDDLAHSPEFRDFLQREFPSVAGNLLDLSGSDRRTFIKLMGASIALAGMGLGGLAGCRRWPETTLAPYAHRPADRSPGVPVHYATNMDFAGVGAGLLVASYDGRPIKIEGNPQHPINQGSTTLAMQAAVLDMYDQDRSRHPMHAGKESTWQDFTKWAGEHFAGLSAAQGKGLAFLCEATSSPSVQAMRQRIAAKFPAATWHEYEALNNDHALQGSTLAFGGAYRPMYDFSAARTIVSLDADFLGEATPASLKWTRDFAAGRHCDNGAEPSRLYSIEGVLSLTGANADHRVAVRNSDVSRVAAWLASQLGAAAVPGSLAQLQISPLGDKSLADKTMHAMVEDLKSRGPSIVVAGPRQPAQVHLLANLINRALGNEGKTVSYMKMDGAESSVASLKSLVEKINADQVQTLVMIGGNPVYNAPADLNFAAALKKVPNSVHLADYNDETSRACAWHVNRAHFLEAWGDVRAWDGTWGITQPLLMPLWDGKTNAELLAFIAGETVANSYEITRAVFAANFNSGEAGDGGRAESRWNKALHDGFVEGTAFAAGPAPTVSGFDIAPHMVALEQMLSGVTAMEVVFTPDAALYDGRLSNKGWLQELPDPIAKLVWDNAVLISATAAKNLGVKTGDNLRISCNGKEITAPAMIVPGTHDNVAAVALGYGRGEACGSVGKDAGFDFYPIRTSATMGSAPATITKASGSYLLVTTQDHHAIDSWPAGVGEQERLPTLFREASLATYRENPKFVEHRTHVVTRLSLFPEDHPYQKQGLGTGVDGDRASRADYAWGMSIDLNACTGCNACVIACQAENNIAIVGKDEVKRGREMHWLRIDRYFKGVSEANPSGFMLAPVACMHCENAPCEEVCPVAATTHDESGLNVMVYNRCIGTRYCSNNCPYKVRKFNYFDWWGRGPLREQPGVLLQVEPDYYTRGQAKANPIRQMAMNPEVTVRMRGIMEKCTYCTQRIQRARIDAKNAWVREKNLNPDDPRVKDARVPIADGSFTSACAAACPAKAIVFGDLNDPASHVKKMQKNPRAYQMLEELNTKPRTRYLARIRNPAFGGEETAGHGGTGHAEPAATTSGGAGGGHG